MRYLRKCILLIGLLCFLSCKQKEEFIATDISHSVIGSEIHLPDFNGHYRRIADFKGKVIVLFFGYTFCPDICPTTLSQMASIMKKIDPQSQRIQVIFVSVDPDRDSAKLLSRYVTAFNPSFIALRGTQQEIQKVAKDFKVFYQKYGTGPNYTIDHSSNMFIFDKQGQLRLLASYGMEEKALLHDINLLLNE